MSTSRSQLYRIARDLGNVEAVEHGGVEGGAKRYARRAVYRKTNSVTGGILRALGVGHQNPDQTAKLALHIDVDHHPPCSSLSSTSGCAGSLPLSGVPAGPSGTRTSKSWCSSTRFASSNVSFTHV